MSSVTASFRPGQRPAARHHRRSVAAALGFTWKAITDALKKAATRLERPLCGAELGAAAAVAVTYLPAVGPPAPDIQLLDKSPFFLRALHVTGEATDGQGATREELTSALTATFDRNRREGSAGDKWAIRVRRLRGARPDGDAITYWLAWARAAGYVVALDDTHYDLSAEGERLAQIPPRPSRYGPRRAYGRQTRSRRQCHAGRGHTFPSAAGATGGELSSDSETRVAHRAYPVGSQLQIPGSPADMKRMRLSGRMC